ERTREAHDRAFGRRVAEQRLVPLVGGDRRRIEDHRARFEVRQRRLNHEKIPEQVRAKRLLEFLGVDLERILGLVLLGCIVDQNVEPAEFLGGFLHGPSAEAFVTDVTGYLDAARTFARDEAQRLVGVAILIEIDDGDVGSLACHGDRGGAADTAVAAGDQRDATFELADAGIFRLVIRLRPHLVLAAGLALLALFGLQAGAHEKPPENLFVERGVVAAVPRVAAPPARTQARLRRQAGRQWNFADVVSLPRTSIVGKSSTHATD